MKARRGQNVISLTKRRRSSIIVVRNLIHFSHQLSSIVNRGFDPAGWEPNYAARVVQCAPSGRSWQRISRSICAAGGVTLDHARQEKIGTRETGCGARGA